MYVLIDSTSRDKFAIVSKNALISEVEEKPIDILGYLHSILNRPDLIGCFPVLMIKLEAYIFASDSAHACMHGCEQVICAHT